MTLLVTAVVMAQVVKSPWYAFAPWVIFNDERVVNGKYQSSWIRDEVSPAWWCGYAACLCGLAVVASLMRENDHRRQLFVAGGVLATAAVGFLLVAVA